jgi:predicted nucleic acid-binding protein
VIVVDASAVVDALTAAPGTDRLRERLRDEELHAPMLLDFEVVSALRGLTLGNRLSVARAEDVLTDYADLPVHRWEGGHALRRRAFQLRTNVSAYDAAYITLAEALNCPLITRGY